MTAGISAVLLMIHTRYIYHAIHIMKVREMGKTDIEVREYFQNRERFADLFNYMLYDGRQVLQPQDLRPADTAEIAVPYGNKAREPVQRFRDNAMVCSVMRDDRTAYVVLGVESQTYVHYAMPVRNMLYDSMNYAGQVERAGETYRRKQRMQSQKGESVPEQPAEDQHGNEPSVTENTVTEHPAKDRRWGDAFLSNFQREDRLMPVITLVVYFSPGQWDGPRSIHEMLCVRDEGILRYVPDYRIHLLAPSELADNEYRRFRTSLGQVLEFIRLSGDKEKLDVLVHSDRRYRSLDRESANLINVVTRSKLTIDEQEEEIDMCKAIDDMRKESEANGFSRGEASGFTKGEARGFTRGEASGFTKGENNALINAVKNVMEAFHVSLETAMDSLKVEPEKRAVLIQMMENIK